MSKSRADLTSASRSRRGGGSSSRARRGSAPALTFFTKTHYVAGRIRAMILSGEMPPGTRVRQEQVAAELGVSATPIREAIRQLEAEGYLSTAPHLGAHVREINRDGLEEVYRVRSMLEGYLAREAASRTTPERIEEIERLVLEFDEAVKRGNAVAARRANYWLHELIWEIAEQPVTLEIVNTLWAKFPWDSLSSVPGRLERSGIEHHLLLRSLAEGNPEEAESVMRAHILGSSEDYFRFVATAGDERTGRP